MTDIVVRRQTDDIILHRGSDDITIVYEASGGGGVTDHGELTGLDDDDHPRYRHRVLTAAELTAEGLTGSLVPGELIIVTGGTVVGQVLAVGPSTAVTAAMAPTATGTLVVGDGTAPVDLLPGDPGQVLTVDAGGGLAWDDLPPSTDAEAVRDIIGSTLVEGTAIDLTVDDPGDTITVAVDPSGLPVGSVPIASLSVDPRDRSTHTGTQAGSTVDAATTSARGTIRIATDAETQAGSVSDRAVVPSGLHSAVLLRDKGGRARVRTLSSASGAVTVDLADGLVHDLTLTGAVTLSLTGAVSGSLCWVDVILRQDTVGSRAVTWPSGIRWPSGIPPTLSGAASSIDVVHLRTTDGGSTWLGWQTGMRMS